MIKTLKIHGLKSIKDVDVDCKNLNIYAGTNSSGKSTILQSLLIFSQMFDSSADLNGPLISLGDFREVKSSFVKDGIRISLTNDKGLSASVELIDDADSKPKIKKYFDSVNPDFSSSVSYRANFFYIPFDRIGVSDMYPKNMNEMFRYGLKCENAIDFLNKNKQLKIADSVLLKTEDETLLSQVNYWLNFIVDASIKTEEVKGTDYVKAEYNLSDGIERRPKNMGAGISYILPMLIVCLSAPRGSTIVIENPEIHLHPKAQSKLMDFLYFIADSGRQLFIETHSDHIFDGIRAGIATETMNPERIAVNFVTYDDDDGTENHVVEFDDTGSVLEPMPDLFDQFGLDLNRMLGL